MHACVRACACVRRSHRRIDRRCGQVVAGSHTRTHSRGNAGTPALQNDLQHSLYTVLNASATAHAHALANTCRIRNKLPTVNTTNIARDTHNYTKKNTPNETSASAIHCNSHIYRPHTVFCRMRDATGAQGPLCLPKQFQWAVRCVALIRGRSTYAHTHTLTNMTRDARGSE